MKFFKENFRDILMYGLNGLIRSLLVIGLYNILLTKINYIYSNVYSILIVSIFSSVVNITFVFKGKLTIKLLSIQLFLILKYMLMSSLLLMFLVNIGILPKIAQIISVVLLFPIWFILTKYSIARKL